MEKKLFVCCSCGGQNVEVKGWINPNTETIVDDQRLSNDESDTWCNDCEDHMGITSQEQYNNENAIFTPGK